MLAAMLTLARATASYKEGERQGGPLEDDALMMHYDDTAPLLFESLFSP